VAIEYLGNKRRLLDFVTGPIGQVPGLDSIADLFCGTASVSGALRARGLRVVANDHLRLCATLAEAALLADGPPLDYAPRLAALNALEPEPGFLHRTYSPAGGRMYLTEANAAKLDAVRAEIEAWSLPRAERATFLRDLVRAVVAISNTAGTYGCYLKTWKRRALEPLTLTAGPVPAGRTGDVLCEEAETVAAALETDAVYLDPPYTKRQYGAYYHLLETLVSGATPAVEGSTGLPPWRSSDFCYKRRAPGALARLLSRLDVPHVFLSYSDDGHIAHEQILDILGARGRVRCWELASPRYRSSALVHKSSSVRERLYHLALT
jgi:adenine-specific DNA-methyltransferase